MTISKPALTKYTSFEALKKDTLSVNLPTAEKERLDAEAKQMAELLQELRCKQNDTITLPARKAKEIPGFADFVSKLYEEQQLAQGIHQLVSENFDFLNDEEDLYTGADLKEVHNG